jgi:NlpC/P60 family putative phage cell wall peptidase
MVVAEARTWLGTPFRWQASQKGIGCDCKGLLWGVARELGFPEAESLYAKVADYSPTRPVPSALLKEGFAGLFDPVVGEFLPGDILLLKFNGRGGPTNHIAIASGNGRAIHARDGAGVTENALRSLLKLCPVDSAWRWRP